MALGGGNAFVGVNGTHFFLTLQLLAPEASLTVAKKTILLPSIQWTAGFPFHSLPIQQYQLKISLPRPLSSLEKETTGSLWTCERNLSFESVGIANLHRPSPPPA